MIVVASGFLSPELVEAVQRFRGSVYLADGAVLQLDNGHHIEALDETSYHLVFLRKGEIKACLRYKRDYRNGWGRARIGGWAVAPELRGTRVGVRLALEAVRLAEKLGDQSGIATATTRHHSADILKRLGGKLLARYWDRNYGCEMEYLEFHLSDMRQLRLAA